MYCPLSDYIEHCVIPCWVSTSSTFPLGSVRADNVPCQKKKESWFFQRYVCVCTSTYCDTIETPVKLNSGQYHHYSTAKATPGFTLLNGTFDTSESEGLHSSGMFGN